MSNIKRLFIILIGEALLIVIGLIKVSFTALNGSTSIPNFTAKFMLGYSIPIVSMGLIVFFCCWYILRERKVVTRLTRGTHR